MKETSKHQLWSKVVLKAAFHGVGVKHLICTEMWCTKSLPLCQGEPVSAAPTEKESCPKFSSKKYLVLEPPPLTTELLGTAVLGGIRLKGIIFLLMERLALGSLFFMCFCTFPKKVRSHLGGWEVAAVSGATHSLSPTAVALMQGGPRRLLWLPNPLGPLKQVFVVGKSRNLQGDCALWARGVLPWWHAKVMFWCLASPALERRR